ncbi:MAG TPA: hypothetical protein VF631_01595 [Allosphingosinicella sp.]|uniref:DUF4129 domain-containing protein n=1 Tax=Allosphingosinicella sp. TaxID=2823234 RepID=UPI002F297C9F
MASVPVAGSAEEGAPRSFDEAHRQLLADKDIQFTMEPFRPEPPPAWLKSLIETIVEIWPVLRVLFWIGLVALVLYLLYQLAKRLAGERWPWRRSGTLAGTSEWRPQEGPARALLAEADRLAADGRFDEAAHLLLFRSIEDIDARRPQLVQPALTSRDIASAPDLPDEPRRAFQSIVLLVERSLFGGRRLARPDWEQCRANYEAFAFAGAWAR